MPFVIMSSGVEKLVLMTPRFNAFGLKWTLLPSVSHPALQSGPHNRAKRRVTRSLESTARRGEGNA